MVAIVRSLFDAKIVPTTRDGRDWLPEAAVRAAVIVSLASCGLEKKRREKRIARILDSSGCATGDPGDLSGPEYCIPAIFSHRHHRYASLPQT